MQHLETPKRYHAGVTLVELMIVVVIAAILASIAAPSFISMIRDMRLSSASSQLFADLNIAKSEAIKRNARVLVCAYPSGAPPTACAVATPGPDRAGQRHRGPRFRCRARPKPRSTHG